MARRGTEAEIDFKFAGLGIQEFVDGLPGGFFIYEATGEERIVFANQQMAEIFGCDDVDDFLELVGGTFPGLVYHEDRLRVQNTIWAQTNDQAAAKSVRRDHVSYRIADKTGHLRYIDEYGRLVRDTALGDLFFVFVAEITDSDTHMESEGNADVHSHVSLDVDALTGLNTMHYYHSHTQEVLAHAAVQGVPMAVVYFDVDHFRSINFRLGYEGGDRILQQVAAVLQKAFPGDLLARFSDDHFVLITQREGLEARLAQVHDRVSHITNATSVEIKAGVFELDKNDLIVPFAHDRAKVAVSSIKGRFDCYYRVFDESLSTNESMRDYVISHLEDASQRGWLHNYYQPVVRVGTQACCGMEALSRWIDPERGVIAPAQFIGILEEARLIHLLDKAVIERACIDIKEMQTRVGTAVPVSINFSPMALSLLDIPSVLEDAVRRHGIARELLHVEVTESSLAENPDALRYVIGQLHELGYMVWMDDFGSGYSSLNLLKDYDFDVLKIDLEFLRGLEGNAKSQTIVRSIVDLAHTLGMTTLVEGVETHAQMAFLKSAHVDRAQGFLFSEPVPFEAIVSDFFLRYPPERRQP